MKTRGWGFDLQRFAEGEGEGGQAPEYLDFGGRRVAAGDTEALRGLHSDYTAQQRELQRAREEARAAREEASALRASQADPGAGQPGGAGETGPSDDELAAELMSRPSAVLARIEERAYLKALETARAEYGPARERMQWEDTAATLSRSYPDYDALRPAMSAYLDTHPEFAGQLNNPAQLNELYFRTKADLVSRAPAAPNPSDPQFLEKVRTDPQFAPIRDAIRDDYLKNKAGQAASIPPVLGNQPGGASPSVPAERPKTVKEAIRGILARNGAG